MPNSYSAGFTTFSTASIILGRNFPRLAQPSPLVPCGGSLGVFVDTERREQPVPAETDDVATELSDSCAMAGTKACIVK